MSATGVPPTPGSNAARSEAGARTDAAGEEYMGGARLLFSDARVVYLLLNEARSRAIARAFGISGENSGLVTLVALGLAAGTVHRKARQALTAPGGPGVPDAIIGTAVLRESVNGIAGAWTRDSPVLGALVIGSLVAAVLRPVLGSTFRGVKTSAHVIRADFDHRYGHIVRRSRRHR